MRQHDDGLIDPQMQAELDAIDAALAGESVDPRHAEVAELALLVAGERPRPGPGFAAELDARFAAAPGPWTAPGRRPVAARRWWTALFAGGLAVSTACAVVFLLVLPPGSSGPVRRPASPAGRAKLAATAAHSSASAAGPAATSRALAPVAAQAHSQSRGATIAPVPNGRKVVRSAELDLATAPNHIDAAAQGVFAVVGSVGGIVDHSTITQTGDLDGSASFALRIPSQSLTETLGRLSSLDGAQVLSRTDDTQDVNQQYISASRSLADAKALRTALLRQLAAATTATEIASLKAQIHDAETAIARTQAAISSLNGRIAYSNVAVTVSARTPTAPPVSHGGGFTLGRAAHVAGRVLVVIAGGALIALAVLVPVGLVAALLAWGRAGARRRRREQALDLA